MDPTEPLYPQGSWGVEGSYWSLGSEKQKGDGAARPSYRPCKARSLVLPPSTPPD
jgi:hypothetical protein